MQTGNGQERGLCPAEKDRIQPGKKEWTDALTDMWMEAFGDSRAAVERFYRYFPVHSCAFCYVENGTPVSVIHVLKAQLWTGEGSGQPGNEKRPVWYLYAGATRRDCRGRGYYACLIREVCRRAGKQEDGEALPVLVPVMDKVAYYKHLGFHMVQEVKDTMLCPGSMDIPELPEEIFSITRTDPAGYKQIRDRKLGAAGYVEWEEDYLSYAIEGLRQEKGEALKLRWRSRTHIILVKCRDGRLCILETTLKEEEITELAGRLAILFDCEGIMVKGSLWMSTCPGWEGKPYCKVVLDE